MSNVPEIFISSTHYGLEDLRAGLHQDLTEFGVKVMLSSESDFPTTQNGIPPYTQCLRVLERCSMVIGIIDRRYGSSFSNWGPRNAYNNLSPTHGEFRHALRKKIPLNIFVRQSLFEEYQLFRKSRERNDEFNSVRCDKKSFELLEEMKLAKPAPWIQSFMDVRDLRAAVHSRLLGYMAEGLRLQYRARVKIDSELRKILLQLDSDEVEKLKKHLKGNTDALSLVTGLAQKEPKSAPKIVRINLDNHERLDAALDLMSALFRLSIPKK